MRKGVKKYILSFYISYVYHFTNTRRDDHQLYYCFI